MSKKRLEEIRKRFKDDREVAEYAGITLTLKDYDWLIEQVELVKELEDEIEDTENIYIQQLEESARTYDYFKKEIERYKQALEFYADQKTYETNVVDQWEPVTPINNDKGLKARKALEESE